MDSPGNWDWQSPLRHIASGGHNTGDIVNGWRWTGERWEQEGGGGGGGSSGGGFNFDWEAARKAAFDPNNPEGSVLGRYYLQKLKDANFDTTRAKRLLQEDYDRGMRISQEDYTIETRKAEEDYGQSTATEALQAKEERRSTIGGANQRGVLFGETPRGETTQKAPYSQYAKGFLLEPMEEKQRLRSQAIERALQRQKEISTTERNRDVEAFGIGRTRGLEEANIAYPREQARLQEETREKAYTQQVPQQYSEEYAKYLAAKGG